MCIGVLQPVLTFGPTCAPNQVAEQIKTPYFGWAISAQYVNTIGSFSGYTGCLGGDFMAVNPGDILAIEMKLLNGTTSTWFQKVTSSATKKSVEYTIDMKGQKQGWAEYVIELYDEASLKNV